MLWVVLAMGAMLFSFSETTLFSQEMVFKSGDVKATLLELYSSEGCSSCPPAEAWIGELKTSPGLWKDLFPVVFHVDYWDGFGWPDRFAQLAFTERQRNYAALAGSDSVYTPEFIANGREWAGRLRGEQLPSAQAATRGELTVSISEGGKKISATYVPENQDADVTYTINVALLGFDVVTDVERGENEGRQLRHDFVVLGFGSKPLTRAGESGFPSGQFGITRATRDAPGAVAAWISTADGSILQITGGWLKSGPSIPQR